MDSSTLADLLKEIRVQINEAFDILDDEDLDEETTATVWQGLDSALEDIEYIIDMVLGVS